MVFPGTELLLFREADKNSDCPGIYGYLVDFFDRTWKIVDASLLWEPVAPVIKDTRMAEIFSFLKFGQPMVVKLVDGSLLLRFWYAQEGQ